MALPALNEYIAALSAVLEEAPETHKLMVSAHLLAGRHQITATELARAAGYAGYEAANLQYGRFARRVCERLNFSPPIGNSGAPTFTYVLATPTKLPHHDWLWTLHPVVAEALNALSAASTPAEEREPTVTFPDEVPEGLHYLEGAVVQRLVNARERATEARSACLEYWGTACSVCEIDAAEVYGVQAARFIHVHHLQPLSSLTEPTITDARQDLRPVCPNCHTVLHMTVPPMSVTALRLLMRRLRSEGSQETPPK